MSMLNNGMETVRETAELLAMGCLELEFAIDEGPRDRADMIDEVLRHVPLRRETLESAMDSLVEMSAVALNAEGHVTYVYEEALTAPQEV